MDEGKVYLTILMRDWFEAQEKWPRFTYSELFGSTMIQVYHLDNILAFLTDRNVVVRAQGHFYNYCGTRVYPLFDRFIPEHPDFIFQVSNAVDIGIRLIESGKPWIS
jgi:hypothetical protein